MADWLTGTLPPPSTSTTTTTKETPPFYTDYLQNIANFGNQAATAGGVAGFSPLQTAAFGMAPTLAFSGQETAGMGQGFLGQAGQGTSAAQIQQFMNPYTANVVDEMARLQQRNIQERVIPGLKGAMGATGQFGSQRQAQVAGQTLRDMQADLLGRQYGALERGYTTALGAAQGDLDRILKAGSAAGNLAIQQQAIGTGGLEALSKLGAIEQAQGQKILDYPMDFASKYAGLMSPYAGSMPTTTTQQETGVRPGISYGPSPLATLGGLLTGLGAFLYGPGGSAYGASQAGGGGSSDSGLIGDLLSFIPGFSSSTQTPAPIVDRSQPVTSGGIPPEFRP
jgi:hypothetical protein